MTSLNKWKLTGYLAAIFLAGAMTGAFVHDAMDNRGQRRHGPPSSQDIIRFVHDKMVENVGITEEQWTSSILPIVTNTTREIGDADARNREQIGRLIEQSDAKIMEVLNPEQKERMQTWIEERHKHPKGGRPKGERR